MKRMGILFLALIMFSGLVFAQTSSEKNEDIASQSELYPLRLDIVQIQVHSQGYRIIFRKGTTEIDTIYVPASWFVSGGKAALIRGQGEEFPYMVVFYKSDRSFSHLKIYAKNDNSDPTWGSLKGDPGDVFNIETITIEL